MEEERSNMDCYWTQTLNKEIEIINNVINEDLGCPFSNFGLENNCVSFELKQNEKNIFFRFIATEDYPEGCFLHQESVIRKSDFVEDTAVDSDISDSSHHQNEEKSKFCNSGLTAKFIELAKDYYKEMPIIPVSYKNRQLVPITLKLSASALSVDSTKSTDKPVAYSNKEKEEQEQEIEDDDDDDYDNYYEKNDDDDDDDCYYSNRRDDHNGNVLNLIPEDMHPELKADLQMAITWLSDDVVTYCKLVHNNDIWITLKLETPSLKHILTDEILKVYKSIDIELICSCSLYYNRDIHIEARISQSSKGTSIRNRELAQLKTILERFLAMFVTDVNKFNNSCSKGFKVISSNNQNLTSTSVAYLNVLQHALEGTTQISNNNAQEFVCNEKLIEKLLLCNFTGFEISQGLLYILYHYASQRLFTLNEYCIICDDRIPNNIFKSAVCGNALCIFSHRTIGVGSFGADWISEDAEVMELLMTFFTIALKSSGPSNLDILNTRIVLVDPHNGKNLTFTSQKEFDKLNQVLQKIPSMHKLLKHSNANLKEELDKMDPLVFPLLKWINESERSHIVPLPKCKRLKHMNTHGQYLLSCNTPEKEKLFTELKNIYGSTFAFHGSPPQNWYSIIHRGLLVGGGSENRSHLHGATCRDGIYISKESGVSCEYSRIKVSYNSMNLDSSMRPTPETKLQPTVPAAAVSADPAKARTTVLAGNQVGVDGLCGKLKKRIIASDVERSEKSPECSPPRKIIGLDTNLANLLSCVDTGEEDEAEEEEVKEQEQEQEPEEDPAVFDLWTFRCIALCEVIKIPDLDPQKDILIISNPDHICTRFLFVYDNDAAVNNISTNHPEFHASILKALKPDTPSEFLWN